MAKAKVDFTQVLLQHGERIGLGVAGSLAALLVLTGLFWPNSGLFSGSPAEKAKALQGPTESLEGQLRSARPTEADLPPKTAATAIVNLDTDPLSAEKFRIGGLVPEDNLGLSGRRVPKVYPIDEAVAEFNHVQIQTYVFASGPGDDLTLITLEGGSGGPGGGPGGEGRGPSPQAQRMMQIMGGRGGSGGGSRGGPPPGALNGLMSRGGAGPSALRTPGMPNPGEEDGGKKDRKTILVNVKDLAKRTDVTWAEQIRPLRLVVIGASFPYKKQLEEFKSKLSLSSLAEVLGENSLDADPITGQAYPNFRFMGVEVERRELDGDGNPVTGARGQFKSLDLKRDYQPYLILTGYRFEDEPPELSQVMFPGLVMRKLKQFRKDDVGKGSTGGTSGPGGGPGGPAMRTPMGPGGGLPGGSSRPPMPGGVGRPPMPGGPGEVPVDKGDPDKEQYPPVETKLALLTKTLEDIKQKNQTEVVGKPRIFDRDDNFDVFGSTDVPGAGVPGMGPAIQPTGPGAMPGKPGAGVRPPMGLGGKGGEGPGGAMMPGGLYGGAEVDPPEHCLVRLIDVTAEPGKTYEYRMRVKMANPNYKRRDVSDPASAANPDLVSEWSKVPVKVVVPHEMRYYAVDEKEIAKANREKYEGTYTADNMRKDRKVILQIHRWLDTVDINSGNTSLMVAAWSVAERVPVYRGEYIGQAQRVELPVWRYAREDFVIANDASTGKWRPGVAVNFGFGAGGKQPESILIDFQQGPSGYQRFVGQKDDKDITKEVRDDSGLEALVLNPDGRLLLLEGARDVDDKERTERLKKVRKAIREVKDKGSGGAGPGDPKRPFDAGS